MPGRGNGEEGHAGQRLGRRGGGRGGGEGGGEEGRGNGYCPHKTLTCVYFLPHPRGSQTQSSVTRKRMKLMGSVSTDLKVNVRSSVQQHGRHVHQSPITCPVKKTYSLHTHTDHDNTVDDRNDDADDDLLLFLCSQLYLWGSPFCMRFLRM